jgi:homoserine O-succinyltransferase
MPVLVDRKSDRRHAQAGSDCVEIGLLNNMPDAALEATERQFAALLEAGARDVPVRLRLFSLAGVPRGERAQRHLDKPYWGDLTEVMDWAGRNTVSTIWSCLAAHAAVLHVDGIARHLLPEKRIGVFGCATVTYHPLTQGLPFPIAIPHSRHNELRESELVACGYEVLTRSAQAGVDMFVKPGKSLSVFFQGHPEYDPASLLGEYRRDLGRFLRGERDGYPAIPQGYFDGATVARLDAFRAQALAERDEALLARLPLADLERALTGTWRPAAARIYRNWLAHICAHKARRPAPRVAAGPAERLQVPVAANDPGLPPVPLVERRRGDDPSAPFTGPRDRRASVRP